jgi:hypothetical protein
VEELRRVYRELQLPDFAAVEPNLRGHLQAVSGYQKNQFAPLPAEVRERINAEWSRTFDEWSYSRA